MKRLQEENTSANGWDKQIITDLSFIKKHLRYPLRRMTIMPLLASIFLIGFFVRYFLLFTWLQKSPVNPFIWLILGLVALPTFIAVKRYIELIRFFEVQTHVPLAVNMKLLERFLKELQLVTFRHHEAPEIYQIISKNIDTFGDEREVLIFIADDNRILVNSHFTSSRKWFRFYAASLHHHQMIRQLKQWMLTNNQSSSLNLQRNF